MARAEVLQERLVELKLVWNRVGVGDDHIRNGTVFIRLEVIFIGDWVVRGFHLGALRLNSLFGSGFGIVDSVRFEREFFFPKVFSISAIDFSPHFDGMARKLAKEQSHICDSEVALRVEGLRKLSRDVRDLGLRVAEGVMGAVVG